MRLPPKAIGFLLLLLVAGACLIPLAFRPTEPKYNGKPLSFWITQHEAYPVDHPLNSEARDAIRATGTNALPFLLKRIEFENASQWKITALRHLPDSLKPPPLVSLFVGNKFQRAMFAAQAIVFLGTNATPAIPHLGKLARDTAHASTADRAIDILMQLGPVAVPELLASYDDTTTGSRVQMLTFVATRNPSPDGAKAVFCKALNDRDPFVRASAHFVLDNINPTLRPDAPGK